MFLRALAAAAAAAVVFPASAAAQDPTWTIIRPNITWDNHWKVEPSPQRLFSVLAEFIKKQHTTMLLVEQNANLALELADHAYVLEAGRTVLAGPAGEVRTDELVRRAYLGY